MIFSAATELKGHYKKTVCLILCLVMLAAFVTDLPFAKVSAEEPVITGSTATGADFDYEKEIQTINLRAFGGDSRGIKDSSGAFQAALDYAWHYSNDSNMIKIVVPSGTYRLENRLFIHSNTWLYCEGKVTIKRGGNIGPLLMSYVDGAYGYDGIHNVIIQGGIWDGNTSQYCEDVFSNIRIAHGRNILIKNATIINNYNGHHVEIGGVRDLTFEGCYFTGYKGDLQKECIQLDTMNSPEVFAGYAPFDDTPCENVVIRDNKFVDCCRAFGSHSATLGVYYDNILIENNYCRNLESIAMIMFNYKNCTIRNNTIDGCSSAFELKNISSKPDSNIHAPAVMTMNEAVAKMDGFSNTIIDSNTVTLNANAKRDKYCSGVMLTGDNVTTAQIIPNMLYDISGVSVTNNTFNSPATTIIANYAHDCVFRSNTFNVTDNGGFTGKNNIYVENCGRMIFDQNSIWGSVKNVLYSNKSSDLEITYNDIKGAYNNNISLNACTNFNIANNNILSAKVNGGYISTNSSGIIQNNKFDSNINNGLTNFASSITITSNDFLNSGENGINFTDSASGTITNNNINGCGVHGIYIHKNSRNVNIENNAVTQCTKNGIYVTNGANEGMTLKNNSVTQSSYGIAVSNNSNAELTLNTFSGIKNKSLYLGDNADMKINYIGELNVTYGAGYAKLVYPAATPKSQYEIYRMDGSSTTYKKIATVTTTSYTDKGLKASTAYKYKVRAADTTIGAKTVYTSYLSPVSVRTPAAVNVASLGIDATVKSYAWTGQQIKPAFTIKHQGRTLSSGKDYTITYTNNTNVGTATATIKGINGFSGTIKISYNITLKKQTVKKVVSASTSLGLTWTTHKAAGGYQVMVSKSKTFSSGNKTVNISGYSTVTKKISSLSKSTTYYVRVRDYKKVGTKTLYGAWSDVKTAKTTK